MSFSVTSPDLVAFFDVDRICSWVLTNNYRCIALQLPNELLEHAFQLVKTIESRIANGNSSEGNNRKLYVLVDTSYRSCCLDDIAAEHASCDSIVHFGDACLSVCSCKVPALYIFCKLPFDLEKFLEQFRSRIFELIGTDQQLSEVLLICEAGYTHIQDSLGQTIARVLPPFFHLFNFKVPLQNSSPFSDPTLMCSSAEILGRQLPDGFIFETSDKRRRRFLIFVGSIDSPLLPIAQMTLRNIDKTITYCPETCHFNISDTLTNRMLMRRLYLIERLRDARTVGLVIGAVALRDCHTAVAHLRKLCEMAGKKLYVMYIGKLNEAKLSNFGIDVDVFVLLSCPFGIILDGTKFCRPILSVFEADVALNPDRRNWLSEMRWTPEFGQNANNMVCSYNTNRKEANANEEEVGLMSLTSGNIRVFNVCDDAEEELTVSSENKRKINSDNTKQLVKYSAGDHFAMRSWRGLQDQNEADFAAADAVVNRQCPCELKQGMDGIASRYANEPSNSIIVQK